MSISPHPDFLTLPLLDVACQANFSQVSHCLSNSLTDLTDMHSKFANCNMQWHKGREERVQTKGGWIPRPRRQCSSAALWSQNVTERMHEISHKYHVHQPSRASAQWPAENFNKFSEATARAGLGTTVKQEEEEISSDRIWFISMDQPVWPNG